jgi:YEATS domain-containing protein 4
MEQARAQREPVTSYIYEELVFNEPTEAMFDILTSNGSVSLPTKATSKGRGEFVIETEALELDRLGEGLRIVQEQVRSVREKLAQREKDVAEMRKALEKM